MAFLTISNGCRELGWRELERPLVIGRQSACDLYIPDARLSRQHCRIEPAADGWRLIDLSSRNGTWYFGVRAERIELTPGVQLQIGHTLITFHAGSPPSAGRYTPTSIRPSDPREALASTVAGIILMDLPQPRARRYPIPQPMPNVPASCRTSHAARWGVLGQPDPAPTPGVAEAAATVENPPAKVHGSTHLIMLLRWRPGLWSAARLLALLGLAGWAASSLWRLV